MSGDEILPAQWIASNILHKDENFPKSICKKFGKFIERSKRKREKLNFFETIDYIVKNTVVTGKQKFIGRKEIPQTDEKGKLKPDSMMALWFESVKNKTVCQLLTKKNLTKDEFDQTFADNVACEYLASASTYDFMIGEKNNKKILSKLKRGKKIKISQGVIAGSIINMSNHVENFVSRLSTKTDKTIKGIEDVKEKAAKAKSLTILKILLKKDLRYPNRNIYLKYPDIILEKRLLKL